MSEPASPDGSPEPVDLGVIQAHPVAAPETVPPGVEPGGSESHGRVQDHRADPSPVPGGAEVRSVPVEQRKLSSLVDEIGAGAAGMARGIVDTHRGPKLNSRPVPNWIRSLAWLLDESIPVAPGRRVGVDGVISFIPGVGDAAGLVASMVVVLAGVAAGVSLPTLTLMMVHVGIDTIVGTVPFLGAIFDLGYKANTRNLRLIERDLADRAAARRSAVKVFLLSAGAITGAVVLFLFALIGGTYLFVRLIGNLF